MSRGKQTLLRLGGRAAVDVEIVIEVQRKKKALQRICSGSQRSKKPIAHVREKGAEPSFDCSEEEKLKKRRKEQWGVRGDLTSDRSPGKAEKGKGGEQQRLVSAREPVGERVALHGLRMNSWKAREVKKNKNKKKGTKAIDESNR